MTVADELEDFIRDSGLYNLPGGRKTFGERMIGVYRILHDVLHMEGHVCLAGGLHAIYGKHAFRAGIVKQDREEIATLFGPRAEYLAYVFGRTLRPSGIEKGVLVDRLSGCTIVVCPQDLYELRCIEGANLFEQGANLARYRNISRCLKAQLEMAA